MGKVLAGGYPANKMMRFVVPLLAAILAALPVSAQEWGQVATPTPGPPQSIGFYSAGCLQGAQALPLDGPGYEAIRTRNATGASPSPSTSSGRCGEVRAAGGRRSISATSASRAATRQNQTPATRRPRRRHLVRAPARARLAAEREPQTAFLVRSDDGGIDDTVFTSSTSPLRLAADANLDRLFVNKWIKQRLCGPRPKPVVAARKPSFGPATTAFPCSTLLSRAARSASRRRATRTMAAAT
jgi:penicillin-insensitive murein endopeptidase